MMEIGVEQTQPALVCYSFWASFFHQHT